VHTVTISFKKKIEKQCEPDKVPSGCHLQNKMITDEAHSVLKHPKRQLCRQQPFNPQINYSNQQYRLEIANKHP